MAFCNNVKREREIQGLTQDQLADESGIDIRTLQRIEACEQNPSLDLVISLSIGLKMEIAQIGELLKEVKA